MSSSQAPRELFSHVPVSGLFLSLPVLLQAFPQRLMPPKGEQTRLLRLADEGWDDGFQRAETGIHIVWIKFILIKILSTDA